MKTNIILFSLISLLFFSPRMKAQPNTAKHDFTHKENGWYHVLSTGSLSSKPIITVKDFVGLKLEKDYFGKYAISGQISKHKLNKWADETEKSIGEKIAFVFNDSIITAPQVNCRIESGTFMITSFSDQKLPEIYKGIMREKSDSLEVVFNGWEKDSLYYELSPEQRDSVRMNIDYWEAQAWIDLTSKPEEHYWYSIQDSAEYKKLEKALKEELKKPNFSSRATDHMKSDAYKAYKQYLHENKDYINLMFQGFLFNNLKGLNGYFVDDIIQSKYPYAPSIRSYIDKTDNVDDEKLAVYEWQRKVWYQMNREKSPRNNIVQITYRNGYILDKKGDIIGNYANGHIFDKGRSIKGFYSNGFIYDKNHNIIGNYNNGFVTFKKK